MKHVNGATDISPESKCGVGGTPLEENGKADNTLPVQSEISTKEANLRSQVANESCEKEVASPQNVPPLPPMEGEIEGRKGERRNRGTKKNLRNKWKEWHDQKKAEKKIKKQQKAISRKMRASAKWAKQSFSYIQDVLEAMESWQSVFCFAKSLFVQSETEISDLREQTRRLSEDLESARKEQEALGKKLAGEDAYLRGLDRELREAKEQNAELQAKNEYLHKLIIDDAGLADKEIAARDRIKELDDSYQAKITVKAILAICTHIEEYNTYAELRSRVNHIMAALADYKEKTGERED